MFGVAGWYRRLESSDEYILGVVNEDKGKACLSHSYRMRLWEDDTFDYEEEPS